MKIQYSTEAREWAGGFALLEKASALLAEFMGPQSSQQVTAEWSRVQDHQGRTLYRLTIRDFIGQASTDFALDELQNPQHLRARLYRLWGDLLKIRNDYQHQQVLILSSQLTSGEEG